VIPKVVAILQAPAGGAFIASSFPKGYLAFAMAIYRIDLRRATLARASRDLVAGIEIPMLFAICFIE
jgi:hypothetical protein